MPVNLEWAVDHAIVSPQGTLLLNALGPWLDSGDRALFLIKSDPYTIVPAKYRQVTDDLSQADGSSLQQPYISGLVASLRIEYWICKNGNRDMAEPACGADLRAMDELLTLHLNALRTPSPTPDGSQRLIWTPDGYGGDRMLTQVLLAAWPTPAFFDANGGKGVAVTFALATPFPYALDVNEVNTVIADGATVFVPNPGNADYSPVVIVDGPTSEFAITRVDTGEVVSYIGPDAIGPSDSVEIVFFTAAVTSGTDDLIADMDITVTRFFEIPPGGCSIQMAGADATVLTHTAVL